ncbi:MAG: hypothetical protein IJ727_05580 [Treponema sp.]|uniref:hypothetical protein n=1 Tax=Treponema sp. UBA3813 TaxID=1947715 RepID=UPI0025EBD0D0|nr:hypothetical protein [Treponema sp. UBA3813]MBR1721938.1 hypothetical protein [Treponema sp.]
MSYAEFQTFAQQAVLLDVPERIELITFLVKSLPQAQAKPTDKTEVEKINAVLEKIPVSEQMQYCDAGLESVREALKNDSW